MSKTLYDLQSGDKILSEGRYHKEVCVVDRVTKNYVIVYGQKFRKTDGRLVTKDRWNWCYITPLTSELLAQYNKENQHRQLCDKVKSINLDALTIEQLQAILGITKGKSKNE